MPTLTLTPIVQDDATVTTDLLLPSTGNVTLASDTDNDGAGDVIFKTGGAERARINSDGQYKVGGTPEVDNGGNVSTPQNFSLKDGSEASPNTAETYLTPVLYIERHTDSVVPTGSVFWGNARKTAAIVVEVAGYENETGEVNAIAARVQSVGAPGVGQAGNVAISAQAQTAAETGVLNRDVFAANFAACAFGDGDPPGTLMGIEVDLSTEIAMTSSVRPGETGEQRWVGYMAQSAGERCNAGVWITSFDGADNNAGPGWLYGIIAEAYFEEWAGYFVNTLNESGVGGIYVQTLWGGDTSHILEAAGPGGTQFLVDGDANNPIWIKLGGALAHLQQQAGTGTTTGFTAGAGAAVKDDSTFTGNTGSTAYTIGDVVKALKNLGFLAG